MNKICPECDGFGRICYHCMEPTANEECQDCSIPNTVYLCHACLGEGEVPMSKNEIIIERTKNGQTSSQDK